MAGEPLSTFEPIDRDIKHIAIKESVFPFARFPGTDPVLSPEMKSTGEVMGISDNFDIAFAKSQLGGGIILPDAGTVFISVKETDKPFILPAAKRMVELGFKLIATSGTCAFLSGEGLPVSPVNKVAQGRPHIVDRIVDGAVQIIYNTTEGWQSLKDSQAIREAALRAKVPYFTTAAASRAVANAIGAMRGHALEVRSLQSYYSALK